MGNLGDIFGQNFKAPTSEHVAPVEQQFEDAIHKCGLEIPSEIVADSDLHRFRSRADKGSRNRDGWYVLYNTAHPVGVFGCWSSGIVEKFVADTGKEISSAERMKHVEMIKRAKEKANIERKKKHENAATAVAEIWEGMSLANAEHPYLKKKGVGPHGAKVTGDGRLAVPAYTPEGAIATMQYIDAEGGKIFHSNGKAQGSFWAIGNPVSAPLVYIAEGFATAATVYEETGCPCIIAFNCGNMKAVSDAVHSFLKPNKAVLVADNDASEVGITKATEAGVEYGYQVVMPPELGDVNDYRAAGGDVKLLLKPKADDWLVSADDFCSQPAPIKWLVKGWLQQEALIMIHGPSGSGKTFLVLDMAARVAAGIEEWNGHKVKAGNVVYLAGEGHHGLRARLAGWKQENDAEGLNMWISKGGCDLNTAGGFNKVATHISAIKHKPDIIIVDTLHRFLDGDDNSSKDARGMIDACNGLMTEFACTVILVHHTGVNKEAQERARGSSAWKGALDIEINIKPEDDGTMTVKQVKSKDAETADDKTFRLVSREIDGWLDEDGEAVTTAIVKSAAAAVKDTQIKGHMKTIEKAWLGGSKEWRDGEPYISTAELREHLINVDGHTESYAKKVTKPSVKDKLIGVLIEGQKVATMGEGFIVKCASNKSIFKMLGK